MTNNSSITLRQGLLKFYQENQHHLSHNKDGVSREAKAFFKSHDIAHVLFGCDITLFGEGAVKMWTIFGTTLGFWNHLKGYKAANAYELSQNFSAGHYFRNIFKLLSSIPMIIIRARKMRKPWPWSAFEAYLDMPIAQIREEFNIQVIGGAKG